MSSNLAEMMGDLLKGISPDPPRSVFPFFFFVFFIAFVAPLLFPSIQLLKQARKVFKKGVIADVESIFIKKQSTGSGVHPRPLTCEIYYSYKTTRDEQVESKTTCDNDWLAYKLDVGSPIHVAFLENKPQRSMILEAFIR